ncbi:restriction endonuclease [Ursidibacter sp. B-7004-1]
MDKINPSNIRFIKLGAGGGWEKDCIETSHTIRLGYEAGSEIHQECLNDQWDNCYAFWEAHSGTPANHLRQIKDFYQLDENTLWVTFFGRKLYWAMCSSDIVEEADESRTRKVISNNGKWSCTDIKGKELLIDNLDGRITKVQAYRGTICSVELEDYLIRRINGEAITEVEETKSALENLIENVEKLIKGLWWQDFELLTDLVFSKLGWQRYSVLGKTEKGIDLDLYSPSIQKRVFVQIKSDTNINELKEYISNFEAEYKYYGYSEMYYVYHSGLDKIDIESYRSKGVNLINGKKMAELIISAGLVEWLINKRS